MSWTKRQLIESAFEEAGLAAYAFDMTPEQVMSALKRLDALMAGLNQQGVQIGYSMSASPSDSDPDEDSGIPDGAYETVICGLAIRIAPSYGKQIGNDTRAAYQRGLDAIKVQTAYPVSVQLPSGYPMGAGNMRLAYNQFTLEQPARLSAGNDGPLEFTP